jgi:hypothetical protein
MKLRGKHQLFTVKLWWLAKQSSGWLERANPASSSLSSLDGLTYSGEMAFHLQ